MIGGGKPKPLNLPEAVPTPPPAPSRPKPLEISDAPPPASGATPRPLNIPDLGNVDNSSQPIRGRPLAIPEAAPEPSRPAARALNIAEVSAPPAPPQRPERPKTQTDLCVEKAQQIEPTVQVGRIKGRIDTILGSSITDLLDFGNRNLAPLQDTSNRKARIASEISRIDASGWIEKTKDASCKAPSILDRFTAKPPQYWEGMLQKTRSELIVFVGELEKMKKEFFREITDLHLDAIAMLVCSECLADDHAKMTANNRGRTLLQAHQTAAVIQTTIEQTLMIASQHIQQIDHLLSVTIPQWKAAFKS